MFSGSYQNLHSCFGPDDDDDEKFENKSKKEKKCTYNPNFQQTNKRVNRKKGQKGGYGSESLANEESKETPFKSKKPEGQRRMSHDLELKVKNYKDLQKNFDIEYDFGNIEYKLKLTNTNNARIEELVTQMKFRLQEGAGTCYYKIGLEDNGNPIGLCEDELKLSLDVLEEIAERLNATANVNNVVKGKVGFIAEIVVKLNETTLSNKYEINIGLLGEYSSGKSTLIGVLISNKLDNGKGLARTTVFRHKHEILCGKTSTISHQILGFNEKKEITNYETLGKPSWAQIVERSDKIINFYDMGGSDKSFKSTMTTFSPDYVDFILLVIPAVSGISKNTEDYLNYSNSMKIPIITIFTKTDLISEEEIVDCIKLFKYTLKKFNINKNPIIIRNLDDAELFSRNIYEQIIPIFTITNLKWDGLNLFKRFLANLSKIQEKTEDKSLSDEKLEFDIHETLVIEEKVIVSGIVNKGVIRSGSKYHLGPYNDGSFKIVEISNIHCKKIPVKSVSKGQYCSIWIKSAEKIKKEDLRKGMVLLDMLINPVATKIFEADIWTIDGTRKTLKSKYQPVLNIKHIRQGCRIIEFKNNHVNSSKNSSSNNLISYSNSKKNKNLNNVHDSSSNNNKDSQEKNKNEINSDTINNFVVGNISNFNASTSPNNSELKITNIHPLRNLPNKSELKGSFDAHFKNKKDLGDNKIETNENLNTPADGSVIKSKEDDKVSENKTEPNRIIKENTNKEAELISSTILNANNKKNKKNSIQNGPKKTDYNSDNAVGNLNNNNFKENQKANKAAKQLQQHKKSSISKKEEFDVRVKTDFISEKNMIRLNEFNNEYENLKPKETEDNEETCVISPHNNCTVVFEFMYNPEYITEDANILISDQLIKAHGIVRKLLV